MPGSAPMKSFTYFGYGSNMLTKRIQHKNKSATRKCTGILKDYRLDFAGASIYWGGASATIVPHPGGIVWGVLWEVDLDDLPSLDEQEGVACDVYFPETLDVHCSDGEIIPCRVYIKTEGPADDSDESVHLPSLIYMKTIIQGAIESELPDEYIEMLKAIPYNGYFNNNLAQIFGVKF